MKIPDIYDRNKLKIWALIITVPTAALITGALLLPDIFWDQFLFRYFWGPVLADARGEPVNGIAEGYNWVNTGIYGIMMVFALFGIYEIIQHYDIEIDTQFVFSLIPWILLGGSLRALEDAGLFREEIAPLFISPIIYLLLGISAILTMVLGCKLKNISRRWILALSLTPPLWAFLLLRLRYYIFLSIVMLVILMVFYYVSFRYGWKDETYLFSAYGTALLSVSLIYVVYFLTTLEGTNPWEIPIVIGLALLVSSIFLIPLYILKKKRIWKSAGIFFSSLNISIVFAHFLDASSTYRGIEYLGYFEKHVLPSLLIEWTGTSLVMYLLKLFLITVVIYILDIELREDLKEMRGVKNLIKFAIIVLGLAPGFRNMLRMSMGV